MNTQVEMRTCLVDGNFRKNGIDVPNAAETAMKDEVDDNNDEKAENEGEEENASACKPGEECPEADLSSLMEGGRGPSGRVTRNRINDHKEASEEAGVSEETLRQVQKLEKLCLRRSRKKESRRRSRNIQKKSQKKLLKVVVSIMGGEKVRKKL